MIEYRWMAEWLFLMCSEILRLNVFWNKQNKKEKLVEKIVPLVWPLFLDFSSLIFKACALNEWWKNLSVLYTLTAFYGIDKIKLSTTLPYRNLLFELKKCFLTFV